MTFFRPAPPPVSGEIRPSYRPSIDGLRAIAIISVVLYHANANLLPGGFIGVDVFFVISGFLISSLIFKELEQEHFSFADFYARRVRRIFPAIILMMSAVWLAALFLLTSGEFVQLSKYVFAGGTSVANLLEWHEIGYFDVSAARKPLLHLWSLGIEEQFYIVWPLLVVLLWKRHFATVIFWIMLVSFAFNIWCMPSHTVDAFYLPIGRAWELLLGSMLAWHDRAASTGVGLWAHSRIQLPMFRRSIAWKDLAAWLAMLLLAIGFTAIHFDSQFPGWWVLLPTIAALLLIWAGESAWINANILAHPTIVFVGLISYPLYIWHWPLLSLLRIMDNDAPPPAATWAAVAAAFVLAILTWWLVERPLRRSRRARGIIVATLIAAMFVISVLGVLSFTHLIQTSHMAKEEAAIGKMVGPPRWDCRRLMDERTLGYQGCLIWVDPNLSKTFVIWGDSYAGSWRSAAEALAKKRGARLVQFMYLGCPPLVGVRRITQSLGKECNSFALAHATLKTISGLRPSLIILAGRWTLYTDPNINGSHITANSQGEATTETARAALKSKIPETLRRLTHIAKVLIIKGVPTLHMSTEAGMVRDPDGFEPTLAQHRIMDSIPNDIIDQAARDIPGVTVLDPADLLCDQKKCHAILHGVRAYVTEDTSHLSDAGSMLFLQKLEALVK